MSVIKPRTRGKRFVRHRTMLEEQTQETLYAYAAFLGEPPEYVLNQVIDTVLGKDRDFLQWRAGHSDSYVPRNAAPRGVTPVSDSASKGTIRIGETSANTRSRG